MATVLQGFVDGLDKTGGKVDREVSPGFDLTKAADRFFALLSAALAGSYSANELEEFALAEGDNAVAVTKRQASMRHRQWLSHNEGRLQLRRRLFGRRCALPNGRGEGYPQAADERGDQVLDRRAEGRVGAERARRD